MKNPYDNKHQPLTFGMSVIEMYSFFYNNQAFTQGLTLEMWENSGISLATWHETFHGVKQHDWMNELWDPEQQEWQLTWEWFPHPIYHGLASAFVNWPESPQRINIPSAAPKSPNPDETASEDLCWPNSPKVVVKLE